MKKCFGTFFFHLCSSIGSCHEISRLPIEHMADREISEHLVEKRDLEYFSQFFIWYYRTINARRI